MNNDLKTEKIHNKAQKYLETDFSRINDENVIQIIEEDKDEIKEQIPKLNDSHLKKIYQQYFLYDQDDYNNYCYEIKNINEMLLQATQMNFSSFVEYLYILYLSHIKDKITNRTEFFLMIKDYYAEMIEITNNFLHLLAFHLWNDCDEEKRIHRIEAFQKAIDEIPQCHEMFLNLRENPESDEFVDYDATLFDFTPQHRYNNHIVMAIIMNIDIPAVARKLKSIILSTHQSFDLVKQNKKYTQIYEQGLLKNDFKALHECADLFILSYFKDKRLIASYTPFLRHFNDCYFENDTLVLEDNEEKTIQYLNEPIDYDLKYKKKLVHTKKKFEFLLEKLHNSKDKLDLKMFNEIEYLMNISFKSMHYFNPIVSREDILKKYKYRLITYLANKDDFFEKSFPNQIDQLLCICLLYHYVETIDQYEEFMPRKQQLLDDEYINSLKLIIEDKDHIIDIKNQQLEKSKTKKKTKKKISNNKLFEDEIKYYKKEISSLNKQLKNKDLEIENLKKNQKELYKLRELMFEMQQTADEKEIQTIDLYEVIKDKTIIIIGGHISLRDRLKQKYPTLKILSESSHITDAVLLHADHVFMFHKFMTHDMYNRAISALSRNNIPWDYVPYTNLEKSEEVIYHILKT